MMWNLNFLGQSFKYLLEHFANKKKLAKLN